MDQREEAPNEIPQPVRVDQKVDQQPFGKMDRDVNEQLRSAGVS